jgi:hypothetical protein
VSAPEDNVETPAETEMQEEAGADLVTSGDVESQAEEAEDAAAEEAQENADEAASGGEESGS